MIFAAQRLKRACQDVRERYDVGMQVGLPSIKADVADVEAVIKHYIAEHERRSELETEREELLFRIERLETIVREREQRITTLLHQIRDTPTPQSPHGNQESE